MQTVAMDVVIASGTLQKCNDWYKFRGYKYRLKEYTYINIWRGVRRYLHYELYKYLVGEIPEDKFMIFKDYNRLNIEISNMQLVDRSTFFKWLYIWDSNGVEQKEMEIDPMLLSVNDGKGLRGLKLRNEVCRKCQV